MKPADVLTKPLLRGWSHAAAALVAMAGLVALIVITRNDPAKLISMLIYGMALVLLFAVSATYHIFNWPPKVKDWLRRADHATIFIFIAATYTPLVFNVLVGWWRVAVLAAIWICAIAGVAGAAPFLRIPRKLLAGLYLAMGWVAVVALDRKSTRLNSSHDQISYAVFCLKKKKKNKICLLIQKKKKNKKK